MDNTGENTVKHMKPLSKRARAMMWGALLMLFLIIGPIIVAYSFGFRLSDLEEKFSLVRTGGIYIHSNISNTSVFVDGEYFKSGGLLIRNILVQNLKADTEHLIEVNKSGYHSWVKELPVKESLVTEGRVMMLPKEIDMSATYPFVDIEGVGTTTDDSNTITNLKYRELEVLFDLASSTEEFGVTERLATEIDIDLLKDATTTLPDYYIELGVDPEDLDNLIELDDEVAWLEKGNIVMYWIGEEDEIPYYYCNFENCRESIGLDWDSDVLRFTYWGNRNDVWIAMDDKGVWAVEVDDRSVRNIQPVYLGENLDFRVNDRGNIVVLDQGVFYEFNF